MTNTGRRLCATAVNSWLQVVGKDIGDVRPVCSGAGAAAIACLTLLQNMGWKPENTFVFDRSGLIHEQRNNLTGHKQKVAAAGGDRSMTEAAAGADIFLGVSGPGALSQETLKGMAERLLILALANPEPEITPEAARAVRADAIIATGRSTTRIRSTMSCVSFSFSVVPSTVVPPLLTKR